MGARRYASQNHLDSIAEASDESRGGSPSRGGPWGHTSPGTINSYSIFHPNNSLIRILYHEIFRPKKLTSYYKLYHDEVFITLSF